MEQDNNLVSARLAALGMLANQNNVVDKVLCYVAKV